MTAPAQQEFAAGDAVDVLNPPAGYYALWIDTNGDAWMRDSAGVDTPFGEGFGYEQQGAEDDTNTSTTLTSPQNKVTLTTSALVGGDYIVHYTAEFFNLIATERAFIEFLEGTTEYGGRSVYSPATSFTDYFTFSGFKKLTLPAGVANFYLNFWCSSGGGVAIKNSRIHLWRVSE